LIQYRPPGDVVQTINFVAVSPMGRTFCEPYCVPRDTKSVKTANFWGFYGFYMGWFLLYTSRITRKRKSFIE